MNCNPRSFLLLLGWIVIAGATAAPVLARTLWVDEKGRAEAQDGSAEAPFNTINAAIEVVQPGDTVIIRAGTYRERFRVPSGEPGRPITVRAAEGERVIVTGCVRLDGWQPAGGGVWSTTLDWIPGRLLIGGKTQTIAREPNQGWWRSDKATDDALIDPANLSGLQARPTGGEVRVWLQRGNVFHTFPIRSLDTQSGRVTLDEVDRPGMLTDGDKYYLQNRARLIDQPGEWAVEPDAERFKVSFMPRDPSDLERVEAPFLDRSLIFVRDASHVRIERLELCGSRRMGIEVHNVEDVQIRRCVAYQNGYLGISLREARNSVVAQNIAWQNEYGISVGYSSGVTVEENDVGYNGVDGLLVTWRSDNIMCRRNCLHHHLLWGHPDNFQVYRGVTNLRFEENLLLAGGQSMMMEETRDGRIAGNMIVGSGAYMLILGHQNAGHYQIHNNTLAFAGYGCMSLTWEDYDVRENVITNGHGSALFGVRGIKGYRGDRNLLWNSSRAENPMILATDTGWHRDFEAARESTGEDANSLYADPQFRNAPVAFRVLDHRRLHQCTKEKWYLRDGTQGFQVGDYVEVNFDGRERLVVDLDESAVTVRPGLEEKPVKDWLVANWGENGDFRLDLRLAPDSPGVSLSPIGGPVGSAIDIQAYLRGDFDGDGNRDLPALPPELEVN